MKHLFKTALLLFAIVPFSYSQVKSNLELIDIFNMEYVSDPQISPDGSRIIYVRNFKDVMTDKNLSNLWIVNFDGSNNRPLTIGNHNDFYPRWSHDGEKIIFKSNMADEKMKLYMMWMDTKELVPLTNTTEVPNDVAWSYDDKTLAFNITCNYSLCQLKEAHHDN
jgi:acylaminoacyl-peptidase